MARYYQTANPEFVENFVYTPPYELMLQVANRKQAQYDQAISTAKLLGDVQIEHLNGEYDTANVLEKQRYYNDRANSIVEAIRKDPMNVNGYLGEIDKLQKELKTDFTTGEISKITGSKAAASKWEEDNKELLKTDPGRYQAAKNAFYSNWGGDSLKNQWRGEQVTKGLNYTDIRKSIQELEANSVKTVRKTPAGNMYMVETTEGLEEMSKERLDAWVLSQVVDPESLASLSQSEKFGLGTYKKEDGTLDFENGTLFAPLRGAVAASQYQKITDEVKYDTDGVAVAQMNEAGQNARYYAGLNWEKTKHAIDREDKIIAENNKTTADKINAYEIKIAEAQIAGDENAVSIWENKYNNLVGRTGLFNSNAGSIYGTTQNLQTASAQGDRNAQKIIDQQFNQLFRSSGINFKNPQEKAAAEKLVGAYKQGKINEDNLESEIAKIIPTKYTNTVDSNSINLRAKALKQQDDMRNAVLMQPSKNKPLSSYTEEAKKQLIKSKGDLNQNFRNNFVAKAKDVVTNFKTNWENSKSKFSTTYETSPLSVGAQSSIKSLTRDPNISKQLFIEKDGKNETLLDAGINIVNYTSAIGVDGRGRNGIIGIDENGKQYKITANKGTPAYQSIMNIAKGDVNPNSPVGLSITYPTTSILKSQIEARKVLGQRDIRLNIKSDKGNNYTIQQVGNTDMFNVIDNYGKIQTESGPIDYMQAGIMIDKLDNK